MSRHLNRNMCRRPEAVKPQLLSRGDRAHPKASVADDSRAHERRHLIVGKLVRNRVNEIFRRNCVLRIAAVHCISRELGLVAKILLTAMAVRAGAIRFMQPGDAYAFPYGKAFCLGTEFFDRSHNLVAGNQRRFFRRKFALDHVQVGAANATQTFTRTSTSPRPGSGLSISLSRRGFVSIRPVALRIHAIMLGLDCNILSANQVGGQHT